MSDYSLDFKITIAENMSKKKIVILTHPDNKDMMIAMFNKIKEQIDKLNNKGE